MKANNGTGNVAERDDWETPQWLWEQLDQQYKFTYDCCATDNNSKTFSYTSNFLGVSTLFDVAWINPPFSKAKLILEHFFKIVSKGVGIYRCDNMETKIWQHIMKKADWIFIFNKRICYEGKAGKGARFGSALFGVGLPPPNRTDGTILHLQNSHKVKRK